MGSTIKAAIADRGTTISDVASQIGLSFDQLSNIINGRTKLTPKIAEGLRVALDKPNGWPLYRLPEVEAIPMAELPLLGGASAGMGGSAVDGGSEPILVPANMAGPKRSAWIADGTSGWPHIHPGDIIVIQQSVHPKNRKVNLFANADRELSVKQFVYREGVLFAHSFNPSFEDYVVDPNATTIIGFMVGLYGKRGSGELILVDSNGIDFDDFA